MRVKIIKNIKPYKSGEIVNLKTSKAILLIQKGYAILTKDMVSEELWQA